MCVRVLSRGDNENLSRGWEKRDVERIKIEKKRKREREKKQGNKMGASSVAGEG